MTQRLSRDPQKTVALSFKSEITLEIGFPTELGGSMENHFQVTLNEKKTRRTKNCVYRVSDHEIEFLSQTCSFIQVQAASGGMLGTVTVRSPGQNIIKQVKALVVGLDEVLVDAPNGVSHPPRPDDPDPQHPPRPQTDEALKRLQNRVALLERKNTQLKEAFEQSKCENAQLKEAFEQSKCENAQLKEAFEQSKLENAQLKAVIEQSKLENAPQSDNLHRLEMENSTLKDQLADSLKKSQDLTDTIAQMEQAKQESEQAQIDLKKEYEKKLEQMCSELSVLKAKQEVRELDVDDARNQLEDLKIQTQMDLDAVELTDSRFLKNNSIRDTLEQMNEQIRAVNNRIGLIINLRESFHSDIRDSILISRPDNPGINGSVDVGKYFDQSNE